MEDDYRRPQKRLYKMFGVETARNLDFDIEAPSLDDGLIDLLEGFVEDHPDTRLIIVDTLQKVRGNTDGHTYSSDYQDICWLKRFTDSRNLCLMIVHHTRKQQSEDRFDTISGTNGLLGAADGAFLLAKTKRTANDAMLDIIGRDQQDQRLHPLHGDQGQGKCPAGDSGRGAHAEEVDSGVLKIGSNLNQIAHHHNGGGVRSTEMYNCTQRAISELYAMKYEVERMRGEFRGYSEVHRKKKR